jgi:hypothetical protein
MRRPNLAPVEGEYQPCINLDLYCVNEAEDDSL